MKKESISVVIPVYNALPYLKQAVDSILNQTYSASQILLVDDDSNDGSSALMREYADIHPHVVYIALPPKSKNERRTALALNTGIALANFPYIALMDADDVSHPDRLRIQLEFMEQHKTVSACGTYCKTISNKYLFRNRILSLPTHDALLKLYALRQSPFFQSSVMLRKSDLILGSWKYDERLEYAEDYEFFSRFSFTNELANIPLPLLHYRMHAAQSIHHPAFLESIKWTMQRNVSHYFRLTNEEIELHILFANHRETKDVKELLDAIHWGANLTDKNNTLQLFDDKLFQQFITFSLQTKIKSACIRDKHIAKAAWRNPPIRKYLNRARLLSYFFRNRVKGIYRQV
jgi:glycosyltransferase involved in cell wall biosynthesis